MGGGGNVSQGVSRWKIRVPVSLNWLAWLHPASSLSAGESETMKQLSGKVTQLTEELQDTKLKLDQQVQQNQILGKVKSFT